MTGLVRNRFEQTAKRRVQGFWFATTLVVLTLPAAMAQTAGNAPTAAVTDSPAYKRGRLLYIQCRACHDLN